MTNLRDKVVAVLTESGADLDGNVTDDTPLIQSGKLDSLSLLNLALFIEGEIGREVDIPSFDLATEWNTINGILSFIAKLHESTHLDGRAPDLSTRTPTR